MQPDRPPTQSPAAAAQAALQRIPPEALEAAAAVLGALARPAAKEEG